MTKLDPEHVSMKHDGDLAGRDEARKVRLAIRYRRSCGFDPEAAQLTLLGIASTCFAVRYARRKDERNGQNQYADAPREGLYRLAGF